MIARLIKSESQSISIMHRGVCNINHLRINVCVFDGILSTWTIGMSVHACRDNKRVFTSLHARNLQRISPFRRESFSERGERVSSTNLNERPEVTSIGGNVSCNIRSLSASCPTPYVYTTRDSPLHTRSHNCIRSCVFWLRHRRRYCLS